MLSRLRQIFPVQPIHKLPLITTAMRWRCGSKTITSCRIVLMAQVGGLLSRLRQVQASAGAAIFPQIVIDNNGNALAVWQQDNMIMANRFDGTSSSWGTAESIDENMENPNSPQIVIDNDGKALAVWQAIDLTGYKIMVNRFDGSSWGIAEPIVANSAPKSMPQLAINNNGKALAVWRQRNLGSSLFQVGRSNLSFAPIR